MTVVTESEPELIANEPFEPVYPWAVKSVRQTRLLDAWLHQVATAERLPELAAFHALDSYPDLSELMIYDVVSVNGELKYRVVQEGAALISSFGFSGKGKFLNDVIDPRLWRFTRPIYDECVAQSRPVYSVFSVFDNSGRRVSYERLLLPFGSAAAGVTAMVASLKTTSWNGEGFENKDLMRPEGHDPAARGREV